MYESSPEAVGAVQARLAYLRRRKGALDDLISCLESYAASPPAVLEVNEEAEKIATPLAGSA